MFFHFRQNNSGGNFEINGRVSKHVIIEADSAAEANEIANKIGIYFDGVASDIDCPCCGDRWCPVVDSDSSTLPEIFCFSQEEFVHNNNYCHIYFSDGKMISV